MSRRRGTKSFPLVCRVGERAPSFRDLLGISIYLGDLSKLACVGTHKSHELRQFLIDIE